MNARNAVLLTDPLARERATGKDYCLDAGPEAPHPPRLGEPPPGPITTEVPIPVAASHMRRPAT